MAVTVASITRTPSPQLGTFTSPPVATMAHRVGAPMAGAQTSDQPATAEKSGMVTTAAVLPTQAGVAFSSTTRGIPVVVM